MPMTEGMKRIRRPATGNPTTMPQWGIMAEGERCHLVVKLIP